MLSVVRQVGGDYRFAILYDLANKASAVVFGYFILFYMITEWMSGDQ